MSSSKPHREHRDSHAQPARPRQNKLGFFRIVFSTLAAAFGVQSNSNRERDFNHGSLVTYIAAGITFTVVFIVAVILLVRLILRNAGV